MQRQLIAACAATLLAAAGGAAFAEGYGRNVMVDMNASVAGSTAVMGASGATKMVGGAAMYPTKDIVDNAVNSRDHTTLVAAVKAAGLVDTLKSTGPFTVFAPTNNAFSMLPAGTVDTLLKPENKQTLTQVLTYHVVPGKVDAASLAQQIKAGGGKAMLKTASGGTLTASMRGNDVLITDAKGNAAVVTTADVYQSNGVIHVVDKVLLPS
ncbi:fasciclin domain-containing protein [Ramlibacter sp. HM2]|uniref:Fasciclin domain-containing protein n=2 Tax=Ramlibacter pallidus TaxID=2780087 RepID=A0ABR9S1H7_9BURK|nr:fasciclin domain-containing protein [Ramlibacter pallidus]